MRRAILVLVDGLRADVGEAMLAAGELPHLAAMTAGRGVGRAVTAFPSTTCVAYLPYLTGCLPGRLNVPGIRWLDRSRYAGRWWRDRYAFRAYTGYQAGCLDSDYPADVHTLFELVPRSLGIFTPIARGLTPRRDPAAGERKFWGALAHFIVPLHRQEDRAAAAHLLRAVREPWRFIFAQFPAVDGFTHSHGPDAEPVRAALRHVDTVIGEVRAELARRDELAETLIVLVSDHGAAPVHTHLDLTDWFTARGVPALSHPSVWTRNPRVALAASGNGHAMVYARPGEPRAERWSIPRLRLPEAFGSDADLVAALAAEEGVAFVAGESGRGSIEILSRLGSAEVRRAGDRLVYRPLTGDPLELGGARAATSEAWLAAACDDPYPDAAMQLLDQFSASRTGDLVVAAREGWDLRNRYEVPEHHAGHGSLVRSHMLVPLWASRRVPELPLRSADVFPALLDWLGEPVPPDICGRQAWLPGSSRRRVRRDLVEV